MSNNSLDWKHVFNSIKDSIVLVDTDGLIKDCNEVFKKLVNKTSSQIIGYECSIIIFGRTEKLKNCPLLRSKRSKKRESLTVEKNDRWFNVDVDPIFDENQITGFVLFISDITERKITEDALKTQNLKYQTLLLNLNGMVYHCNNDKNWTMKFISTGCLGLTGYSSADLLDDNKLSYNDLILPKYKDYLWNIWQEKLQNHEPVETEYEIKTASGEIKWIWERGRGVYDNVGQLIHLEGFITDITERKHAEQIQKVLYDISNAVSTTDNLEKLIQLTRKELGTIIDTTNFYIALYDQKTDTFALPFLSDDKDEIKTFSAGKTLTKYIIKTKKSLLIKKKGMKELEKSGDIESYGTDSEIWLGVPLKIEEIIIGVLAVQSYTDEFAYDKSDMEILEFVSDQISISIKRKQSELALQENEERYKYLFDQSPTSIWEEDFSEVYKYLASLKMRGIEDFKEYFENHLDEVKKCSTMVHILDVNEMTIKLFNAKNKKDLVTNLGSIFIKDSLSPFIDQLCAIAENQTRFTGEFINKTLDGKLLNVIIKMNVVPGYEKDYSKVLISLMDITEQKKAEEGLRLGRERLKLLNQIIRHDFANDFIVIKSAVNIFRRSSEIKMIDEIERRADKSLATIDTYRKYESFIDSNADLNKIETSELINKIIIEYPKINFSINGKCNIFADDALDSVFTNLISNSIKHGNSTKIDIKISSKKNICEIKFMDNGTGIPDKIKDKIFNEGFIYGKAGHTGLGLHIVKKTIERYGGTISVEDNSPNGTVFIIRLRQAL